MRARLHHAFLAEIVQLDADGTRTTDPDGAGPLVSGYDDDFDEIVLFTPTAGRRTSARVDLPPVFVPVNIEANDWNKLDQQFSGNVPDTKIQLVTTYNALAQRDLIVPATGEARIRTSDKLIAIRNACGEIIRALPRPFFITEVKPSFGIATVPDLFLITIEDRERGVPQG